jgi:hypothetical protein
MSLEIAWPERRPDLGGFVRSANARIMNLDRSNSIRTALVSHLANRTQKEIRKPRKAPEGIWTVVAAVKVQMTTDPDARLCSSWQVPIWWNLKTGVASIRDPSRPPAPPQPGAPPPRSCGGTMMGPNRLNATSIPISDLTPMLSRLLGRSVIDETGLKGNFDVSVEWTPDETQVFPPRPAGDSPGPTNSAAPTLAIQKNTAIYCSCRKRVRFFRTRECQLPATPAASDPARSRNFVPNGPAPVASKRQSFARPALSWPAPPA